MENKYKAGDRVRIIPAKHGQAGWPGYVTEVEDNAYMVRGFWYQASELTLIADADVIEYARHQSPAAAATAGEDGGTTDFYSEFERGWDGATQSMLDILERALNDPAGGDALRNVTLLVQNFRQTYPKHGKRQTAVDSEGA